MIIRLDVAPTRSARPPHPVINKPTNRFKDHAPTHTLKDKQLTHRTTQPIDTLNTHRLPRPNGLGRQLKLRN
jgi:hypothetical protein